MRLLYLVILLAVVGGVVGGKGKGGGGRGRSKGGGSGWFFGSKNKKPTGEANYPRQPSPAAPPDARPPAYNPGYPGPPPVYSKNAPPYPQNGGHAPPPPYSQYPQQGHYPQYPQQGHFPQHGHYPQYGNPHTQFGGYGQGHFSGFPQYPQHYGGGFGGGGFGHGNGYFGGYPKRKGFGLSGIIPIPIPIPIGGGGFGYGSYGGGYYRHRGSSEVVRDRESKGTENHDDSKERPRIMAPPDFELEGVTELPGDAPIAQWDIVGKETAAAQLKKRDDFSGEFADDN